LRHFLSVLALLCAVTLQPPLARAQQRDTVLAAMVAPRTHFPVLINQLAGTWDLTLRLSDAVTAATAVAQLHPDSSARILELVGGRPGCFPCLRGPVMAQWRIALADSAPSPYLEMDVDTASTHFTGMIGSMIRAGTVTLSGYVSPDSVWGVWTLLGSNPPIQGSMIARRRTAPVPSNRRMKLPKRGRTQRNNWRK